MIGSEKTHDSWAVFSKCRRYRYALGRAWDPALPQIAFIGLNPSTADETTNDPTIRRCIQFAKSWEFGSLVMLNLFAFCSTSPKILQNHSIDLIGPRNNLFLERHTSQAKLTIFVWGTLGGIQGRDKCVIKMVPNAYCLGMTKNGHPKHPLYLRSTTAPIAFSCKTE